LPAGAWAFHAEENGDASTEATLVLQTAPRYWRMIDCSGARRPEICEARLVKLKDLRKVRARRYTDRLYPARACVGSPPSIRLTNRTALHPAIFRDQHRKAILAGSATIIHRCCVR
jgi:hypothetical protein